MARQPGGLEWLRRAAPVAATAVAGLVAVTFVWTRLVSREGLELILPVRAALILLLLACLLVGALTAPERSSLSRFFRSRSLVFLGTYSYGLYVYHHFISYYMTSNRTDLVLAGWLGSHLAAVTLQATLGMSRLGGRGLPELRVFRQTISPHETAVRDRQGAGYPTPGCLRR